VGYSAEGVGACRSEVAIVADAFGWVVAVAVVFAAAVVVVAVVAV